MKKIIGRTDKVSFPDLNLNFIDVKIDTGAYTSAIHCSKIRLDNNILYCSFDGHRDSVFNTKEIAFKDFSLTDVKSSNGYKENRYKIKTNVIFFGKSYKINLTLSTRDDMRFPVLIGRQFLTHKFLVDVDLENQSFNFMMHEYSSSFA